MDSMTLYENMIEILSKAYAQTISQPQKIKELSNLELVRWGFDTLYVWDCTFEDGDSQTLSLSQTAIETWAKSTSFGGETISLNEQLRKETVSKAVIAVEEYLLFKNKELPPSAKAHVISLICDLIIKNPEECAKPNFVYNLLSGRNESARNPFCFWSQD